MIDLMEISVYIRTYKLQAKHVLYPTTSLLISHKLPDKVPQGDLLELIHSSAIPRSKLYNLLINGDKKPKEWWEKKKDKKMGLHESVCFAATIDLNTIAWVPYKCF